MGTPGPRPTINLEDTLAVFEALDRPSTPLTAPEVAAELSCARRTAHRKLQRLAERGDVETKKVGANGRVWWRPLDAGAVGGDSREGTGREAGERDLERYETIVETVEDGIYTVDSTGRFTMVNDAYVGMTGYDREELVGSHTSLVVDESVVESAREVESELVAGERERVIEADIRRADDTVFPAEATFALLPADGGEFERIGVVRDLSERIEYRTRLEETVEKLEASNERLEEFASVASHDLRNPLTVAQGRVELARADCESEHLVEVERAHERMWVLIENLLTLAREGRTVTEFEPVALDEVVESGWRTVETAGARLDLPVGPMPTVEADRDRLQQLFENLIRNSVEHGSTSSRTQSDDAVEHGSTSPRSQAREDSVEHGVEHGSTCSRASPDDPDDHGDEPVTVRVGPLDEGFYLEDDGPGIPVSDRERVLENGFSTTHAGTGFGLSIVKQIVDAHGWSLTVTESATGGARFEVTGVEHAVAGE